jgi:hypothetical protein
VHYIESFIPGTEPTAFCPIHSPFGAVGGAGPLGGTGTAPDGAPQPTAPLPPGAVRPASPTPVPGSPDAPAPRSGTTTGVMGGAGPAPNPQR